MELDVLRKQIDEANQAYWVRHQPIMTDQQYDALIEQLRILDPTDIRLTYIGGVQGEVVHNPPMLSLDKRYSHDEIVKWCSSLGSSNTVYIVQPKYDGIAGKLVYTDHGWQLSTRGDGHIGEDITDKLPYIDVKTPDPLMQQALCAPTENVIQKIKDIPIYGEIVLTNTNFEQYFKSGKILKPSGEKYTTQRNTVAGILSSKEPILSDQDRVFTFVDYRCNSTLLTLEELQHPDTWEQLIIDAEKLDYPMDGLVLKISDPIKLQELGVTQHHPRGMMAFKFANESETSNIIDIVWNVGMRSITPKAIIEPVKINGVTIGQATLFNLRYVIQNHFSIGDQIKVERAGDVVPHICCEYHVRIGQDLNIPRYCPSCGCKTHQEDVELVCTNPKCPGVLLAKFQKAAKELKLDGFGKVILSSLIQYGVTTLQQLLTLDHVYFIQHGFGEKTSYNLEHSLKIAKQQITPAKLLSAMGIPRISQATAASLLVTCPLEELVRMTHEQMVEQFRMHGENGKSLVKWLSIPENLHTLTLCMMMCTNLHQISNTFEPKVCFTGKMSVPRSELAAYAARKGYRSVDQVTKDVDILVVPDDISYTSDKLQKARRYGIQILTETQFRNS